MALGTLNRKLGRDLWRLRGQVLAAALIIATGITLLVMARGVMVSLEVIRDSYYERNHFAQVFASAKRAPERLARAIADLPGVRQVETRIVEAAPLDMPDLREPATAQLISLPERGRPGLNRPLVRHGRWIEPGQRDEILLSEKFAAAHGLGPGDRLRATINGRRRDLAIVGLALSPEFIYAIAPGDLLPLEDHNAVVWMGRDALAAAFDLDGAFNNVVLDLSPGMDPAPVVRALDGLLARYGGIGAYGRKEQPSHAYLDAEIEGLRSFGLVSPAIILAVAAFVLNVIIGRTIETEREQIGLMKAFGYSRWAVAGHYGAFVLAIAALGAVIGSALGAWLGWAMTGFYADFFTFPYLYYDLDPAVFLLAALFAVASGALGMARGLARVLALPPAQAMRTAPPAVYRRGWVDRLPAGLVSPTGRMVLRHIGRWPVRAALTALGIAMAMGTVVSMRFMDDSMAFIIDVQYNRAQRQDLTVTFTRAQAARVRHDLAALPGVRAVEPFRMVPVRLRLGARSERIAIQGLVPRPVLSRPLDSRQAPIPVPEAGLTLSTILAQKLDAHPGDAVIVEVLEGRRPVLRLPLAATADDYVGKSAYMGLAALNRALDEAASINGTHLMVDPAAGETPYRRLKDAPLVRSVSRRAVNIETARKTMAEAMLVFSAVFTGFAAVIAFGVLYNGARVALSEQGRELASLRVLGFTRGEAAGVLVGELALLTVVALPLGGVLGYLFAWATTLSYDPELFRVPLRVEPRTYVLAAGVVLAALGASALVVRRRVARLNLIDVLKTRE